MKHGNTFYLELSREIFTPKYTKLSSTSKWLFIVLNELEQRFTGKTVDYFYRSNEDLSIDTGIKLTTLKISKKELLETDLIESWQMHWLNSETGKKSEKKVTAYRILK